jgi:DNA-binding MarR family transcriptional regulator
VTSDLGLVDALAQLSFLVHNALADIAARRDLSMVQVRLLGVLRDREPTMNELGRLLDLDKSSITGLVDRAQRRDLVTRTVSATDRRAFQVSITAAGRLLAEEVVTEFTERIRAAVAPLPEADRHMLSQLASRIVTADAGHRGVALGTTDAGHRGTGLGTAMPVTAAQT